MADERREAATMGRKAGEQFALLAPASAFIGAIVAGEFPLELMEPITVAATATALAMAIGTSLLTMARNLASATKWGRIMLGLVALVPLLACTTVSYTDGTQTLEVRAPGAVCATWDPGESFMLSTDPRSDFGTVRAFEWLVLMAAYVSPWGETPDMVEQDDRAGPHGACRMLFDGLEVEERGE